MNYGILQLYSERDIREKEKDGIRQKDYCSLNY